MRNLLLSILCVITILAPLSAQQTTGWRTDGTGRYPQADPPTVWGVDKNVVWKTPMPSFSVATPVIVGDKIFTTSDPTTFICVNKADGKILWEKKCTRDEIPWTDAEKEKLRIEREQAAVWNKEHQAMQKEINALEKRIQEDKEKAKELRKPLDRSRC
jgi:hypothetical protein